MEHEDLGAIARAIIDANQYMTIGTADQSGTPLVSRVWRPWTRDDVRHLRAIVSTARPSPSFSCSGPQDRQTPVSID